MPALLVALIVAVPAVLGVIVTVQLVAVPEGTVSTDPDSVPPLPFASVSVTPETAIVMVAVGQLPPTGAKVSVSAVPTVPELALCVIV